MLIAFLTKYLGARALKAVVGGVITTGVAASFTEGFSTGLTPFAHDLGAQIAVAIGTFLMGHISVYLTPNKPAKPK